MAEKRKLLAEMEKCFKKIDEGVELFEETMAKMQEANSDNQREKFQDDLKKEIKKLQRLRDQIKGWQNSSDIKDKERLTHYRKVIEQRMEQFKDIERENKTKPHSKQGLSAEEKLDPREKEKADTIEWLQSCIRSLETEADVTEAKIEALGSTEPGKKRGKKDELKKADKEKMEEHRHHLDRMKFHISKLEVCMRLVNNETLESKDVVEPLKDALEMYIEAFDPDNDEDPETLDPESIYDDLDLGSYTQQLGGVTAIGTLDDPDNSNASTSPSPSPTPGGKESSKEPEEGGKQRHSSGDVASVFPKSVGGFRSTPTTPLKLTNQVSVDSSLSSPPPTATPPPPPPGIPYNSIAAANIARQTSVTKNSTSSTASSKQPTPAPIDVRSLTPASTGAPEQSTAASTTIQQQFRTASPVSALSSVPSSVSPGASAVGTTPLGLSSSRDSSSTATSAAELNTSTNRFSFANGPSSNEVMTLKSIAEQATNAAVLSETFADSAQSMSSSQLDDAFRNVLRIGDRQPSRQPQEAFIPPSLGASPLGKAPPIPEHQTQLVMMDCALQRMPLQMDSEKPRSYLPKMPCQTPSYYPQVPPPNADSLEYFLRLSPETLFFTFYYMEGSRAQLLAAKALKKLSWRFHTKYLMWFQRHEEPKQITDDFEQGTYVYFDFEKWAQRKKEQFTFEYRYLEDKDFE
uniref:CCR4-NOT transcription complex subunit 3 n=1 Tax=Plectus sambesii TaxID=2011161 RepID=A0A914WTQ6_9BILA